MLSHYVQISSSIHARLFGSVRSGGAGSLRFIYCLSLRLHASSFFIMVCSDTTMDQTMDLRCVRAANALMRLCICRGSFELSMFT